MTLRRATLWHWLTAGRRYWRLRMAVAPAAVVVALTVVGAVAGRRWWFQQWGGGGSDGGGGMGGGGGSVNVVGGDGRGGKVEALSAAVAMVMVTRRTCSR